MICSHTLTAIFIFFKILFLWPLSYLEISFHLVAARIKTKIKLLCNSRHNFKKKTEGCIRHTKCPLVIDVLNFKLHPPQPAHSPGANGKLNFPHAQT